MWCAAWLCGGFSLPNQISSHLISLKESFWRNFKCVLSFPLFFWLHIILCSLLWKPPYALTLYPSFGVQWNAYKSLSPLDLVRYRLAYQRGHWSFKTIRLSLSKAQSIGKQGVRAMEIACPLWPRATGVETELTLPLSITARGALQKLLSYTYICMASWA